jgi:hypothetical protein
MQTSLLNIRPSFLGVWISYTTTSRHIENINQHHHHRTCIPPLPPSVSAMSWCCGVRFSIKESMLPIWILEEPSQQVGCCSHAPGREQQQQEHWNNLVEHPIEIASLSHNLVPELPWKSRSSCSRLKLLFFKTFKQTNTPSNHKFSKLKNTTIWMQGCLWFCFCYKNQKHNKLKHDVDCQWACAQWFQVNAYWQTSRIMLPTFSRTLRMCSAKL